MNPSYKLLTILVAAVSATGEDTTHHSGIASTTDSGRARLDKSSNDAGMIAYDKSYYHPLRNDYNFKILDGDVNQAIISAQFWTKALYESTKVLGSIDDQGVAIDVANKIVTNAKALRNSVQRRDILLASFGRLLKADEIDSIIRINKSNKRLGVEY